MLRAKDLAYIGIFVSIIAICSWISIPLPLISFTMQTFAVSFAAFFLDFKKSFIAIISYLVLGCAGIPVFNGFTGGLSCVAGPTGGFLIGFIPMVTIISLIYKLFKNSFVGGLIAGALGLIALYIVGLPWLTAITMGGGDFFQKLALNFTGMILFLLFDFVKMILALLLSKLLKKKFERLN